MVKAYWKTVHRTYFRLMILASYAPDRVIDWLIDHTPEDDSEWNFGMDASYAKYIRHQVRTGGLR